MDSFLAWLKRLVPSLLPTVVAALLGAGVGGYITQEIVTSDTRTKLLTSAYSSYLTEAAWALSVAQDGGLTEKDIDRLHRSSAILELTASREVWCRAIDFMSSVESDGYVEYSSLVSAMRKEIRGEEVVRSNVDEECVTFLGEN